jgi:hypothetical protein
MRSSISIEGDDPWCAVVLHCLTEEVFRSGNISPLAQQKIHCSAMLIHVFRVLGEMASRFRTRDGESLVRMEKAPNLPIEVTTPSLEAWRSYRAAWTAVLRGSKNVEAVSLAKRAIEIDPGFAMAHALLGRSYDGIGEAELAAQNISRAYQLRDRVSDRETFSLLLTTTGRFLEIWSWRVRPWNPGRESIPGI